MIPIDTTEDLGDALALLRRLAGLTQTAVGEDLGTNAGRIGNYERAVSTANTRTLMRHLAILGHRLAIVPLAPEGHADGLSVTLADQGAEIHSPPRVDLPEGAQAISGGAA